MSNGPRGFFEQILEIVDFPRAGHSRQHSCKLGFVKERAAVAMAPVVPRVDVPQKKHRSTSQCRDFAMIYLCECCRDNEMRAGGATTRAAPA